MNIGDFNADGYEDFAASSQEELNMTGRVYIYFGGQGYNTDPDFILDAPMGYDLFGFDVSAGGDFNADGYSDLIVVAKNFNNSNSVAVMVYFGVPLYDDKPDVYLTAQTTDGGFADVVSNLGDINGDGLDDIFYSVAHGSSDSYVGILLFTAANKSPRIISVKDVPEDQGGKVNLVWFKSGFQGQNVNSYRIERSIAPVGVGFAWEVINTIQVTDLNYYSYIAPTLNDQTSNYSANTYFRITALTERGEKYHSNIMYGHSVDNLAPSPVGGLNASYGNNKAKISWTLNSEPDMKNYLVYRSTSEKVSFDTLQVYGTTTDSVFVDENPLEVSTYYFVRPVDIHKNIGQASSVLLHITDVEDGSELPTKFSLAQNYPNPFNPSTTIKYAISTIAKGKLSNGMRVTLKVYDVLGRKVATLVDKFQRAGNYSVTFNASNLSSGIYYYRLKAGNFVEMKKMILLK